MGLRFAYCLSNLAHARRQLGIRTGWLRSSNSASHEPATHCNVTVSPQLAPRQRATGVLALAARHARAKDIAFERGYLMTALVTAPAWPVRRAAASLVAIAALLAATSIALAQQPTPQVPAPK